MNRFVVSQPSTDTWGVRAPGALDFESVHASGTEATTQARAVVRTLGGVARSSSKAPTGIGGTPTRRQHKTRQRQATEARSSISLAACLDVGNKQFGEQIADYAGRSSLCPGGFTAEFGTSECIQVDEVRHAAD